MTNFIVAKLLKIMSQAQYLKNLEKEIRKLNQIIDEKIMRGESYRREARDHKLMMRHLRYHNSKTGLERFFVKHFSF